jgi:hypothetical protein
MELLSRDRTICGGLFAAQRVRKGQLSRSNTLSSGRRVTDRQVSALEFGGPLIKVDLPRRWRAGTAGSDPKPTLTKGEVEGVELGGAPISVCVCSMTASRRFLPFAGRAEPTGSPG